MPVLRSAQLLPALFILAACTARSPELLDDPGIITRAEFARLQWLEGTWRGSGGEQGWFFERYHFPNDTSLIVETYADSTLVHVQETALFVLSGGRLSSVNPRARYVATGISARGVTFSPIMGVRNTLEGRSSPPAVTNGRPRQSNSPWGRVFFRRRSPDRRVRQ